MNEFNAHHAKGNEQLARHYAKKIDEIAKKENRQITKLPYTYNGNSVFFIGGINSADVSSNEAFEELFHA